MSSTSLEIRLLYKILVPSVSATLDLGFEVLSQVLMDVGADPAAAEWDCNV
jgi:hypothetical protein